MSDNLPEDMRKRVESALNVIDLSKVFFADEVKKKIKQDAILVLLEEVSVKSYKQGVSDALFNPDEHSASETSARNTRLAGIHREINNE